MRLAFDASAVGFAHDRELNVDVVVLAEHQDGSGRRLELQRALDVDDDDTALGHDTYCLVTADGATYYGGIVHWQITASTLDIALDRAAARALGVAGFRITVPQAECARLEATLRKLVA